MAFLHVKSHNFFSKSKIIELTDKQCCHFMFSARKRNALLLIKYLSPATIKRKKISITNDHISECDSIDTICCVNKQAVRHCSKIQLCRKFLPLFTPKMFKHVLVLKLKSFTFLFTELCVNADETTVGVTLQRTGETYQFHQDQSGWIREGYERKGSHTISRPTKEILC